jgi:predicted NAD/FAD-dependent oxidoreductase
MEMSKAIFLNIQKKRIYSMHDVIIIGGGIAGSTAAQGLRAAGQNVVVVDKARGPSGRLASRRSGTITYDHGAPLFRVHSPAFAAAVTEWEQLGWVKPWQPRWGGPEAATLSENKWYVPVPRASALCRGLLGSTDLVLGSPVVALERAEGYWAATLASDELVRGKRLVLAVPAPQAAKLLQAAVPHLADQVASVPFVGTWAIMAEYDQSLSVDWEAWRGSCGELATVTCDHWKPDRNQTPRLIAHANPEWSQANIDLNPEGVAPILFQTLKQLVPETPITQMVHRWRYAHADEPLGQPLLQDGDDLVVIGDWCLGAGIGAAWQSGQAVLEAWSGSTLGVGE